MKPLIGLIQEECEEINKAKMNKLTNKRKNISEDLPNSKQKRFEEDKETESKDIGNYWTINSIINLGVPHVGEKIFSSIETNQLVQWLKVSKRWTVLIENVLLKRWRERIFDACKDGKTEIVKIRCSCEKSVEGRH